MAVRVRDRGLEAAPVSLDSVSAQAIFSAFADANALNQIFTTGLSPGHLPAAVVGVRVRGEHPLGHRPAGLTSRGACGLLSRK